MYMYNTHYISIILVVVGCYTVSKECSTSVSHETVTIENVLTSKVLLGFVYESLNT